VFRRTRRRKRRLNWFPPLGSPFSVNDDILRFGGVTFQVAISGDGAVVFTEIPLTFDFGQEAILADANDPNRLPSLADLTLSSWRLRRVVGKIFAAYNPDGSGNLDPNQTAYPACAFAAGLMVRATNELATASTNVDLWNADDYDDPWLWRRSWILGQDSRFDIETTPGGVISARHGVPGTGTAGPNGLDESSAFARFPNTTAHYGSVQDGGHIDQKTNRVIGPEDRLFMHFATKGLPVQPQVGRGQEVSHVVGMFDLRYLGHPMSSTNRRNASR